MSKYALAWLLALGSVAACGSSTTGSSSSTPIALDQVPEKIAASYCKLYQRCSPILYAALYTVEDCATLTAKRVRARNFSDLEKAVAAGKITYKAELAPACLSAIEAQACSELDNHPVPECEAALDGSAADGADCDIDQECKGTSRCIVTNATCPGVCGPRASAGVACTVNDDCDIDLVCSSATQRCVKNAQAGEACGGGTAPQCSGALFCLGEDNTNMQTGLCTEQATAFSGADGAVCSFEQGPLCKSGFSCAVDSASAAGVVTTCHAAVASGAKCRLGYPSQCPVAEYCPLTVAQLGAGTTEANCTPLPKEGEACGTTPFGTACAAFLRCREAKCAAIAENGESCAADDGCYSEHCVSGGCAPTNVCAK